MLLGALYPETLSADPLYGVFVNVQYGYSLPLDTNGGGGPYGQALVTSLPGVTSYFLTSSPSFNQEAVTSYSAIDRTNGALYPVFADAGVRQLGALFGQLHSWTIASTSLADPNVFGASAAVIADIGWIDHISFVGAPVGTPIQLEMFSSLHGSLTASGAYDYGSYVLSAADLQGGLSLRTQYSPPQPVINSMTAGIVNTTVGQSFELEEQLFADLSGGEGFSAEADLADTANVYLQVLTPGVSIVSASGAEYSLPSSATTPEPSYLLLISCCLTGLGIFKSKRNKQTQPVDASPEAQFS